MSIFMIKGNNNPWVRLGMLVVALVVLSGSMRYLWMFSNPGAASQDYLQALNSEMEQSDPVEGVTDPLAQLPAEENLDYNVLPELMAMERSRRPQALTTIRQPLLKVAAWLKGQSADWMPQNVLGRASWHHDTIVQEPSRWRLLPLHVYGMLADEELVEYPDNPPGLRKLFWLTLYDPFDQVFFTVLTPQAPRERQVLVEPASGRRAVRGTFMAFDGLYLMAFPFHTAQGERDMPLFYAPAVHAAAEGRAPPPLLDGRGGRPVLTEGKNRPLQGVPGLDVAYLRSKIYNPPKTGDGNLQFMTLAHDLRAEKGALLHIYEYLAGVTPEDLQRMAENPEVNFVSLMAGANAPEWMLGQATGFTGVVFSVETLRFPETKDGIDRIYLVTAGDLHYQKVGEFTWVVAVLDLPEGLRRGDRISASGIFLKLYPYRTEGGHWHWSPLIVANSVDVVPPRYSPFLPAFVPDYAWPWIGAGVGILIVALAMRFWMRSREEDRKCDELRQKLRNASPLRVRNPAVLKRRPTKIKAGNDDATLAESLPDDVFSEEGEENGPVE